MRMHPVRTSRFFLAVVAFILVALPEEASAYPGFLRRIDTLEDWDSIALGSSGIKHIVPGPSPVRGPDGELVPGAVELPCFDFVIYGPGIQHIDILRATDLDCVADFTTADMNAMRANMTQFAGYIARIPDPADGGTLCAVTVHNDMYFGPPEITPGDVAYVMRQIQLTFNEQLLGRLVYLPTSEQARERARAWLEDPEVELDFEVHLGDADVTPTFLRGDANGDGELNLSDPVVILHRLFVDGSTPLACKDAADSNDDGEIDLHDPMRILRYLFLHGPPPAPPFPAPGPDPTADDLGDC